MRRGLIVGLSVLILLGAGAAVALLRDDHRAPLPSQDALRTDGFAAWPEDTLSDGINACKEAESWRLEANQTVRRFAREVLNYRTLDVVDPFDTTRTTRRYHVIPKVRGTSLGFLGTILDVRRYDRCWFVVSASPREGGFPATVAFVHPHGEAHLAVLSTAPQTQIGYGSWNENFAGRRQRLFDVSSLDPAATGHVMTLHCRQVCDVSAWTLGFVPEPARMEPVKLTLKEFARTPGRKRTGCSRTRLRALAKLYAMAVDKPLETSYSKPSVGKVVFRSERQLPRLGIRPIGRDRWSVTLARAGTRLHARVVPLAGDRCWNIFSIDDPARDLLKSVRDGGDSATLDLAWGRASSATVGIGSARGGDSWDIQRLQDPITVAELVATPSTEPFYVVVELRDRGTLLSTEQTWYRAP